MVKLPSAYLFSLSSDLTRTCAALAPYLPVTLVYKDLSHRALRTLPNPKSAFVLGMPHTKEVSLVLSSIRSKMSDNTMNR